MRLTIALSLITILVALLAILVAWRVKRNKVGADPAFALRAEPSGLDASRFNWGEEE